MLKSFQVVTSTGAFASLDASYATDSRKNAGDVVMQGLQTSVLGSRAQVAQLLPQPQQVVPGQRIPPPGEEELVYVNPHQYVRIIKRRLARARLVAKGKIQKERPKYKYETRHLHAKNRVRGEDGRFYSGSTKDKMTRHSKLSTDTKTNTDSEILGGNNGISHLTGDVAALQLFSRNRQAVAVWESQMLDIHSNQEIITKSPLRSKSKCGKPQKMGRRL